MYRIPLAAFGLASVMLANCAFAQEALDQAARQAEASGPIVWYESSPVDQIAKVVATFNKRFPKLVVEHMRDTGGNSIAARVIQESQGGGRTPDIATSGMSVANPLKKRGLIAETDWRALGVSDSVPSSRDVVLTASGFYVIVSNTNLVKSADAPKTWDDLLNPKWKGKIGAWSRPMSLVSLEATWGEPKTKAYAEKFNAQDPFLQKSTFTVAQQVASGETPVALSLYHSTIPVKEKGAPIELTIPEPVSVNPVYSFVINKGKNVKGGQVLAAWLTTPEGAKAYEDATGRGNQTVQGTKTFALLANKKLSHFPLDQADAENAATTRIEKLLRAPIP